MPNLAYETGYFHTDKHGHSRFTKVTIAAKSGLLASDEFFLWGLLALTLRQSDPGIEFFATPHYCLAQLGCLTAESKGGANYAQFRASIKRLAGVLYQCEEFYDPLRKEYRDRGFGFLKYDLPLKDDSSRVWRIVWDPLFLEYCKATAGKLFFDLPTYRSLDFASRRLFLLLHKIFWRNAHSPRFDAWHLAVHGLGFSQTVTMPDLKIKIARVVEKLVGAGIVRLPPGVRAIRDLFTKKGTGSYAIQFLRGPYFEGKPALRVAQVPNLTDSPLYEPLQTVGFEDSRIRSILKTYKPNLVQIWSDITLAKIEQEGADSFTASPQAYLIDNLKHASQGRRTPPDWWRELRKKEDRERRDEDERRQDECEAHVAAWTKARREAFKTYIEQDVGRQLYDQTVDMIRKSFQPLMSDSEAVDRATHEAERHFQVGFHFPDMDAWVYEHYRDRSPSTESDRAS